MKSIMIFLISFLTILVGGCKKEPIEPVEPPVTNVPNLQVLWQRPITSDTTENWVIMQEARDGKVLYSRKMPYPASIQVRDAHNGEIKWTFDNFLSPADGLYNIYTYEESVILREEGDTYCVDMNNGQRNWYSSSPFNLARANQIGDYFYTNHRSGISPFIVSASLVRTRTQSTFSGWDTLYTRVAVTDSFPIFNTPVLWINLQGDSVLIFEDAQGYNGSSSSAGRGKSYLTALNLRTRQVIWRYDGFKGNYIAPPLVNGDRLYITGNSVFCFDLNNGTLLWQKALEGGADGSLVAHNDILVVQSGQIGMWGLNKYTGEQVWYNKDTDGNVWELILFDGVVYCTSSGYGRLYAVNAETGVTIWKERSPNRTDSKTSNASFADARVAIDPERRLLYTADKYYVMCIKLPEK